MSEQDIKDMIGEKLTLGFKKKSKKEQDEDPGLSYLDKMKESNSKELKSLKQISNLILKMKMFQLNTEDSGKSMAKITDSIHKFPHLFIHMP